MPISLFFFFNDTATTEIYTLSLHDALPIFVRLARVLPAGAPPHLPRERHTGHTRDGIDRKSTRLNSSHQIISYAVFCLKKKKNRLLRSKSLQVFKQRAESTHMTCVATAYCM